MNVLASVLGAATDMLGTAAGALGVRAEAAGPAAAPADRSAAGAEKTSFAALLASALAPEDPAAEEQSEGGAVGHAHAEELNGGEWLAQVADAIARMPNQGFERRADSVGPIKGETHAPRSEPARAVDGVGSGWVPRNPIARDLEALFSEAAVSPAADAPEGTVPAMESAVEPSVAEQGTPTRRIEGASVRGRGTVRSLGATDPEFRARFERVIERMEREYGHRVEVVETYRTQERQNQLFEQGRTRPGPVVTWTRNSNHTHGRAADLLIDGRWDNPQGYARLAQVAREEGLRTLGARDPGHVELPGGSALLGGEMEPEPLLPEFAAMPAARAESAARPDGVARVATVASVAEVAPVAQVARVATVAPVAQPGTAAERGMERRREPLRERSPLRAEAAARGDAEAGLAPSHAPVPARSGGGGVGMPSAPAPVAQADAAARVARVMELQQSGAPRELSRVLLRVEAPDGTQDRIRLDLRGSALDATIDVANLSEAGRLSSRVGELQRALAKQGMDAEVVRVRATSAPELTDLARAVAATGEVDLARASSQPRSGAEQNPGRERGQGPFQRESGSDSPGSRNRSRKEQQGGKDS